MHLKNKNVDKRLVSTLIIPYIVIDHVSTTTTENKWNINKREALVLIKILV